MAGFLQEEMLVLRRGDEERDIKKAVNPESQDLPLCKTKSDQPQPPDPQEPELQPPLPPPMELVDVIPKPERGPASINSTRIVPQVVIKPSSTRNVSSSWS